MDKAGILQILGYVVSLLVGGGLVKLFTVGAEKRKITGEGAVAEANAAKTYHEVAMDLIRTVREEADKLRSEVQSLESEVSTLRGQVKDMSRQLEEKDLELAKLKGER